MRSLISVAIAAAFFATHAHPAQAVKLENEVAPLSLMNSSSLVIDRAGAKLDDANAFGSTEDILLILGALGAGLLAGVEWWFENDSDSP